MAGLRTSRAGTRRPSTPLAILPILVALFAACSPAPSTAPSDAASLAPTGAVADRIPLVIDTDMAPDDVVAIASLLRDPAVEVLAITVVGTGEAHCQGGMFGARSIVTMLVPDPITVACGPPDPLGDAQPFPDAWRAGVDSGNGLNLVSPAFPPDPRLAQQVLVDLAASEAAAGRRLTILTIGTLTNVAAAVELDPTLPDKVTLVSMLGAIDVAGNVTPEVAGGSGEAVAEWNAHADPTAVRIVLAAGFDWTLIPLDATNHTPMSEELYRTLEADATAGPADLVFELWSKNPFMRSDGYDLWDPLAAAALRDASIVDTRPASLRVIEGAGLDGGRLVEDPSGADVTIATGADREAFEALLLESLRIGQPRENAFKPTGILRVRMDGESCAAELEPGARAGTLRIDPSNQSDTAGLVIVFNLGDIDWATIEEFAADPPPLDGSVAATPPPVPGIASIQVAPMLVTSAYGTAEAGEIGVACITGDLADPTIALAGPLTIQP